MSNNDHAPNGTATSAKLAEESSLGVTFFFLVASMLAMSLSVQWTNGMYSAVAIRYYLVAFVACMLAISRLPLARLDRAVCRDALTLVGIGVTLHIAMLMSSLPGVYLKVTRYTEMRLFTLLLACCAGVCYAGLSDRSWLGRGQRGLLLVLFLALGIWMIVYTPEPAIDTYPMQQESCAALLSGKNPYAISFKDIYGEGSPFNPKGISKDGRIPNGYSYPPLTLLMTLPGYGLFGDHRYSQLLALVVSGAFLAYAQKGNALVGCCAAVLLFTFPRVFQVLESGWSEPFVVLCLTATIWCAFRFPKAVPWVFGLFLASKQHMFLFAPAGLLLLRWPLRWKDVAVFYGKAAAIGLLVTLPFVAWDVNAFIKSTITIQFIYPARADSLSFPSWFARYGIAFPRSVAFALVPVAYVLAFWRMPRTPAGFACTVAGVSFVFFAFGRAFLNYNFFTYAAMCCAVACMPFLYNRTPVTAAGDERDVRRTG